LADVWVFSELNCVIRTSASGKPGLAGAAAGRCLLLRELVIHDLTKETMS